MLSKFQEIILVLMKTESQQGNGRSSRQARERAWTRIAATSKEEKADSRFILQGNSRRLND